MRGLEAGATGVVGGRRVEALAEAGADVRCLVRGGSSERARAWADGGHELRGRDGLEPRTVPGAGRGVDVAYYLIPSMGRGGDAGFEERERRSARCFADMARGEGVGRVVYLGGP